MRLLLITVSTLTASILFGASAEAQNYPWCSYYSGRGGGTNCGFITFQQCLDNVRGIGGFCDRNTPGPHPSTMVQRRYPY
jgi:Protein of unknown function (DUF3551)